MQIKRFIAVAAVLFLLGAGYGSDSSAEKKEAKSRAATSTLDDQTGMALTIYNVNLGLVKDQRQIKLFKGVGDLRFMDVASQIMPTSVHIKSLINPDSLQVLEQNYEYDLLNPQKLLDKYVGKEVKLYSKNSYTEREEIVTATLLSNNGQPIFKIGDEITYDYGTDYFREYLKPIGCKCVSCETKRKAARAEERAKKKRAAARRQKRALNGQAVNGQATNGQATNGHAANGQAAGKKEIAPPDGGGATHVAGPVSGRDDALTAPAGPEILQFSQHADRDRLRRDEEFAQQVRRQPVAQQQRKAR
jgi:hypothetical protein